jgi:hypothetical protein
LKAVTVPGETVFIAVALGRQATAGGGWSPRLLGAGPVLCYTCCNLKREDLSMRKSLLLIAIAFAGFAGFLMGQVTTESKFEIVKYPLPGSQDTVGEVET